MPAIKFNSQGQLFYLDQAQLPLKEAWFSCRTLKDGYTAIKELRVRGAPLIGVFAAYCICLHLKELSHRKQDFLKQFQEALLYLKSCRPTAVNLAWAMERLKKAAFNNKEKSLPRLKQIILKEAKSIHKEDIAVCKSMAGYGEELIKDGDSILTHCNSGFLATSGEGTALGVIFKAHQSGKNIEVYADETRPLLQGIRLTAWELQKKKIPFQVICDNTAAFLMQKKQITKVFVGADRIAANGDTANKIGTYNAAIMAKYHKIPFYVVAPFSTFDLKLKNGKEIPIEQRSSNEVRKVMNKIEVAPRAAQAYNPAFDVTANELITAFVSDKGIIRPPYIKNIRKILGTS